ncbi:MAG: DMT family transporter [Oscillospiraceae bacterium]|nr:DMT family transporter [Oscillospiraceae bacterium]
MKYIEKHPMALITVGIAGISLSAIFVRYSVAPSAVTAAWRLMWTVLLMLPIVLGKKKFRRETARADKKSALISVCSGAFLAAHFILWFDSLARTTVASAATLVCTEVIWVSLGYCLLWRGKLSVQAVITIAVTFLGSTLIALGDSGAGGAHLKGDILAVLAATCSAAYMLLGKTAQKKLSTTAYTFIVYSACAVALVLTSMIQNQGLLAYGLNPVLVGLALAVCSTLLGHSIFSWALKYFSPSFVSACKLLEPVGAGVLAAILFGELPGFLALTGAGITLLGVWYYAKIEQRG